MANKKKPKINKLDDILSAHSNLEKSVKAKSDAVDKVIAEKLTKIPSAEKPKKTITTRAGKPADSTDALSKQKTKKKPPSDYEAEKKLILKKEKVAPPIKESNKTVIEKVDYPADLKEESPVKEIKKKPSSKTPQEKIITERVDGPVDSKDTHPTAETEKEPSSEPKAETKSIPKEEKAVPYIKVENKKLPITKSQKSIIERVDYPDDLKEALPGMQDETELSSKSPSEHKEKAVPYIKVENKKLPITKSQKTIIERVDYPDDLKEALPGMQDETDLSSKSPSEHKEGLEKAIILPQNEKISRDEREAKTIQSSPDKKKSDVKERFKNSYWKTFFYDAGIAAKDLGKLLKHKK